MTTDSKTILITGGTKGIGFATATKLAKHGHRVIVTGRSEAGSGEAARAIQAASGSSEGMVAGMALDLASFAGVRQFVDAFVAKGWPLHVLINNAGQITLDETVELTPDGIQTTLATNVFGPFLLTNLLLPTLVRSAPARVVNVSSRLHMPHSAMKGEVHWDWENLKGEKSFDAVVFYKNSKLAMMWFTYELNRKLEGKGVTVNAVCPGFVPETLGDHRTGISQFFFKHVLTHFPGTRSVAQAAENTAFAATDPAYASKGGVFVCEEKELKSSDESYDTAQAARFWKVASELTGIAA